MFFEEQMVRKKAERKIRITERKVLSTWKKIMPTDRK